MMFTEPLPVIHFCIAIHEKGSRTMMRPELKVQLRKAVNKRPAPESQKGSRLIVHVDMDAFFAAVEERDNPALHGKPVIVGGNPGERGVVTTCNYKAREYGVHAGMSLTEASRLCPHGVYVRTYGGKYTSASIKLMALLRHFSPVVEPRSIDEACLDATGCDLLWGGVEEYGHAIRKAIYRHLNVTGSVGIGSTRLIAKIAAGMNKPNGLTVIPDGKALDILGPMPVGKIPGVGPATQKVLAEIGIHTIAALAAYPKDRIKGYLGKGGVDLIKAIRGEVEDKVVALEERPDDKSMGHEHTFGNDVDDPDVLQAQLLHLCDKAARRMRIEGYAGNVITLKLRSSTFKTRTHQQKVRYYTDDPQAIFRIGMKLLGEIWKPEDGRVRLIGISVSGLLRPGKEFGVQDDLFTAKEMERLHFLYHAVDRIRDQYGENSLRFAGGLKQIRKRVPQIHDPEVGVT